MRRDVRLAVIGAGIMGANHARVARQLRHARLVAVVDPDVERATAAAAPTGAWPVASVDEVLGDIDAAVVAVPTPAHLETAVRLAEAGIHLLVEKPLARTSAEAAEIVAAAERAGITLAVGHVERFNAAVAELPTLLDRPVHVGFSRISPYSPRVREGVVFDLMIHDLDILRWLLGPGTSIHEVCGVRRAIHGTTEDLAVVSVRTNDGPTATFTTSRLGQQKIRSVEITQEDSVVVADLIRQDITVHRMTRHEYLSDEGARYRQSSVIEIPFLETRGEPLALELQHLIDCIRTGETPRVTGHDGVEAVTLAERVLASTTVG